MRHGTEEIAEVPPLTPTENEELLHYMKPVKGSKGRAKRKWEENPTQARLDLAEEKKERQEFYEFIMREDKTATAAKLDKLNYNEIRKTHTRLWNQLTNRGYAQAFSSLSTVQLGVYPQLRTHARRVHPWVRHPWVRPPTV